MITRNIDIFIWWENFDDIKYPNKKLLKINGKLYISDDKLRWFVSMVEDNHEI